MPSTSAAVVSRSYFIQHTDLLRQFRGSGMFIQDPIFFSSGSRIYVHKEPGSASKNFKYFLHCCTVCFDLVLIQIYFIFSPPLLLLFDPDPNPAGEGGSAKCYVTRDLLTYRSYRVSC
jgi:hypothetical protein